MRTQQQGAQSPYIFRKHQVKIDETLRSWRALQEEGEMQNHFLAREVLQWDELEFMLENTFAYERWGSRFKQLCLLRVAQ